jgi:nucleoside phosphorylase
VWFDGSEAETCIGAAVATRGGRVESVSVASHGRPDRAVYLSARPVPLVTAGSRSEQVCQAAPVIDRRVLVLAPMSSELRPLVKQCGAGRVSGDGRPVYRARIGSTELVLTRLGIGPEMARRTTQWMLERFSVDHVVVCGIAGGLHVDLAVGAVIIPEAVLDMGTGERLETAPLGDLERRGLMATSDHLIVGDTELAELEAQGIEAVEMESAGVAAACHPKGIPWTAVRVISDRPDEKLADGSIMKLLRLDGTIRVGAAMALVVTEPARIPAFMKLGRDSSKAATKAASVALGALKGGT